MIKFNEYNQSVTATNSLFKNPYSNEVFVNCDINMLKYGYVATVENIDINEYWTIAHLFKQQITDDALSVGDQINEPLDVPVVFIDKHIAYNLINGARAFAAGATTIPIIKCTTATDDDYHHMLDYPDSLMIKDGVIRINSATSNYAPVGSLTMVTTVDEAQKIIDQIVKMLQLTESAQSNAVIEAFKRFSNQVYPVGKITRAESTNSYMLFLDKDNKVSLTIIPMLASADENCFSIFVNGEFELDQVPVTMYNCDYLATALADTVRFSQFINRLHNTYVVNYPQYVGGNNYFDKYARELFITKAKAIVPQLSVSSNEAITSGTYDCGPAKYGFVIQHDTNTVTFLITLTNFFVGSMIINSDNYQKLIDNFNTLVKNVNTLNGLGTLTSIRQLLVNFKP